MWSQYKLLHCSFMLGTALAKIQRSRDSVVKQKMPMSIKPFMSRFSNSQMIWKLLKTDTSSALEIYFADEALTDFTPSVLIALLINSFPVRAAFGELLCAYYC